MTTLLNLRPRSPCAGVTGGQGVEMEEEIKNLSLNWLSASGPSLTITEGLLKSIRVVAAQTVRIGRRRCVMLISSNHEHIWQQEGI